MKKYDFTKGISDDFFYVVSPATKAFKEWTICKDGIKNSYNEDICDFDYISMVTKEKQKKGTKLKARCSFESFGAPLIVFSDDIKEVDGKMTYGLHFEIVAYENGINIWSIIPYPPRVEKPVKPTKIGSLEFEVDAKKMHDLEVEIEKGKITATLCKKTVIAECDEIPESFHVGITACEGDNTFSEFIIE